MLALLLPSSSRAAAAAHLSLLSLLAAVALCVAVPARAADGAAWLAKAASAARGAGYSGVYVYSAGGLAESARVTRLRDASGDAERIESLDGARREVVRRGDEIHYFFLDSKTVRVDRRVSGRSFPDFLPADTAALAAHYAIEVGPSDRVAGRAVQVLRLRARDDQRFTHEVWADQQTGLPLKLRLLDERGDTLEQFVFTEVHVGERIDPKQVLPSRRAGYAGWKVESAQFTAVPAASGDAAATPGKTDVRRESASAVPEPRALPAGFRRVAQVARQWPGSERPVVQSVYSDGLTSVSVFVDPDVSRVAGREGYSQRGAVGVVSRVIGDRAVITVGGLPLPALRKLAESIAPGPR